MFSPDAIVVGDEVHVKDPHCKVCSLCSKNSEIQTERSMLVVGITWLRDFVVAVSIAACFLAVGLCMHTRQTCPTVGSATRPFLGDCSATGLPVGELDPTPLPPAMWPLLELIVRVVERSVFGYFLTFMVCWNSILSALQNMIDNYIELLKFLIMRFTTWPNIIIFIFGVAIALLGVALILWVILRAVSPWPRNSSSQCLKTE